jgi:hypothetical protein
MRALFSSADPSVRFYATCYNILENSYERSKKPTSEDLSRFADPARPVHRCRPNEHREMASFMEGLFGNFRLKY